jgi:hypothetical protein
MSKIRGEEWLGNTDKHQGFKSPLLQKDFEENTSHLIHPLKRP